MIRHSRLTALGIMLCVLAALFAVEAKIAWFSPAGSATAQISFDKARPAEPPKALPQRLNSPAPSSLDFTAAAYLFASALLLAAAVRIVVRPVPIRRQVPLADGLSASLFFRPPPVLSAL